MTFTLRCEDTGEQEERREYREVIGTTYIDQEEKVNKIVELFISYDEVEKEERKKRERKKETNINKLSRQGEEQKMTDKMLYRFDVWKRDILSKIHRGR